MALEQGITPVDHQQLDSAHNVLKAWIPTRFYEESSGNIPSFIDDRLKPVKVAAAYIRELRTESERQKLKLESQKDKIAKLEDEGKIEILEATAKEREETIKEHKAYIDRLLMCGVQGLVDDAGASEVSKLRSQNEAKVKEVEALEKRVGELQDLLMVRSDQR